MLLFCLNCIKLKHMPEGPFQATLFSLYSSSFQTNLASLLLVNEKAPYQIFAYERIIAYTVHQLFKYSQHITEYLMSFRQSRYNHSYIIQNLLYLGLLYTHTQKVPSLCIDFGSSIPEATDGTSGSFACQCRASLEGRTGKVSPTSQSFSLRH